MTADVIVIGAGIGGLSAAIWLAALGLEVHVLERHDEIGGKAGALVIDGVEVDTGPSVLTLPHVFDEIFDRAGLPVEERFTLTRPEPAFRYLYPDGIALFLHHQLEDTLASVHQTLGARAARELRAYLAHAKSIWETAAPHFVFGSAPDLSSLLFGGPARWGGLARIDAFQSMRQSIEARVESPHLRSLLSRYATYNGSDVHAAPGTLGCIAHVELSLGGYGILGGMFELVRALERAARAVGAHIHLGASVERILVDGGPFSGSRVRGVRLESGELMRAPQVICNADAAHLMGHLLKESSPGKSPPLSMSAHTGVLRRRIERDRPSSEKSRAAHTVVFCENYQEEFVDIFSRKQVPQKPTIYLCAQEVCHGRAGWPDAEPIFLMVNAPAVEPDSVQQPRSVVEGRVLRILRSCGLAENVDEVVWWRTPEDLARRFPGSDGSLYGAASNSKISAFQRPKNKSPSISGLYLASGSAHPGGGVPLVALSGKQAAAHAILDRKGKSSRWREA